MSQDAGVNLAGVKRIIELEELTYALPPRLAEVEAELARLTDSWPRPRPWATNAGTSRRPRLVIWKPRSAARPDVSHPAGLPFRSPGPDHGHRTWLVRSPRAARSRGTAARMTQYGERRAYRRRAGQPATRSVSGAAAENAPGRPHTSRGSRTGPAGPAGPGCCAPRSPATRRRRLRPVRRVCAGAASGGPGTGPIPSAA